MTQIVLPNTNITGTNLWSQVEDNDKAIRDVVNGDIGADNLANGAVTNAKLASTAIQATGAFYAYLNTGQTIPRDQTTVVQFDREEFDVSGWFDKDTNKGRFTPQKAGYYRLTARVSMDAGAPFYYLLLHKNTTEYSQLMLSTTGGPLNGSSIVYANGSTDYFTVRINHNHASTGLTTGANTSAYFCGEFIGS